MSLPATTSIKGFFAIIILFSHLRQYIFLGSGFFNEVFESTLRHIGQLMVTAYFFYSGFGIAESAKRKRGYVNGFFKKRVVKTLLHFDLSVILVLFLHTILGNHFATSNYFYCWIGWKDIGNSSWFVFAILVLYLISYVVLLLKDRSSHPELFLAFLVSFFTILLWFVLYLSKNPQHWWYDTLAVFPAGMWISLIKEKVDAVSLKARIGLTALLVFCFVLWYLNFNIDSYGICAVLFILALTAVTTFVKMDNPVLQWLGKHCFSIYILQWIPMIMFSRTILVDHPLAFSGTVLASALLLAWAFQAITDSLDTKLFI